MIHASWALTSHQALAGLIPSLSAGARGQSEMSFNMRFNKFLSTATIAPDDVYVAVLATPNPDALRQEPNICTYHTSSRLFL